MIVKAMITLHSPDIFDVCQNLQKIQDLAPDYTYLGHGSRSVRKDELLKLKPYLPKVKKSE